MSVRRQPPLRQRQRRSQGLSGPASGSQARVVYEPTGPYRPDLRAQAGGGRLRAGQGQPAPGLPLSRRPTAGSPRRPTGWTRRCWPRMGALLQLEARPARSPILNDLKDLHMAREALVKSRTAAKNRAKNLTLAILKRHNAEQLRQIERQTA